MIQCWCWAGAEEISLKIKESVFLMKAKDREVRVFNKHSFSFKHGQTLETSLKRNSLTCSYPSSNAGRREEMFSSLGLLTRRANEHYSSPSPVSEAVSFASVHSFIRVNWFQILICLSQEEQWLKVMKILRAQRCPMVTCQSVLNRNRRFKWKLCRITLQYPDSWKPFIS